ncbi:hypothetical protein [Methanoculleus bourgensis]|jgi:hypothetical protein|uniref:hypothetical protein n=1 Tax=Methanoculleus bourgensis TaxID=83986 RepID=UPI00064E47C3|nr:hypothetical protein [Methanoculleus bourgensis]
MWTMAGIPKKESLAFGNFTLVTGLLRRLGAVGQCRLAGRMVGHTLHRSSDLFGVSGDDITSGLRETVFLRGSPATASPCPGS